MYKESVGTGTRRMPRVLFGGVLEEILEELRVNFAGKRGNGSTMCCSGYVPFFVIQTTNHYIMHQSDS